MAYCSKCKRDYPENMKFCHECGSPLEIKSSEEENAVAEVASASAEVKRAKTKLGAQKTVLFLSLITVVVAFAMIVGVLLIVGIAAEKPNYALYVRDGELVYVGVSNRESINLTDSVDSVDGYLITVSRDRQYIIYPGAKAYDGGYSLYVKSLRDSDKTDVKISSSVLRYEPSDDGRSIVYLEGDGDLYRYDINDEDKSKVSTEVKYFAVSENFKNVLYITKDGKLCVDSEAIAEGVDDVRYYSNDFSLIAYSKSRELNVIVDLKESKKLLDYYGGLEAFGEDGAFLYTVQADADPAGAIERVYYCDKTKNEMVVEHGYVVSVAKDAPLAVVRAKEGDDTKYGTYLLCEDELYPLDMEGEFYQSNFLFVDGGKALYYIDSQDSQVSKGDLWRLELSKNGEIKSREKVDSGISFMGLYECNGSAVYYKNNTGGGGDLYVDGELVDYEATVSYIVENTVYYYTNKDQSSGTLKVYSNGRSEKISENVYDFDVSFGGEVFYLTNYDTLRDEGDLYLYRNEKSILIESGVESLLNVYNREK